jgi:DNA-binding MarR family transcriptional regulator
MTSREVQEQAERSAWFPAAARYTGYLLTKLGEMAAIGATRTLEPLGVRLRHFYVLAALAADNSLSQRDVSRLLDIDPNVLVGVIDELEKQGLAERRRNPRDRRRHVVVLTPAGQRVLREGNARLDEAEADLRAHMTAEELAVVRTVAERLLAEHAAVTKS